MMPGSDAHDNHGIARALTGNIAGVIEDLTLFISIMQDEEQRFQRHY
jgi:hypothetical protein